ncbi:MAG: hypothetical protein EOM24_31010, partial [Chloroflexia bacterium]|nr:hypothetical protein [Chloroflexia bacterium]
MRKQVLWCGVLLLLLMLGGCGLVEGRNESAKRPTERLVGTPVVALATATPVVRPTDRGDRLPVVTPTTNEAPTVAATN